MKQLNPLSIILFVVVFGALAVVPQFTNDYIVSLLIGLLMYANLATAWGVFC
ncbi:MAG: branched-chain amino acid ABC transporter permease, partial [Pusillimonas sp.]|nr:branched-chain amino acid ABC transporter permease [Pusillimonas sp.]